jgi:hypothetical protein
VTEEEVKEILQGEFTIDIPNFDKWNPPIKDKKTGQAYEIQMRNIISFSIHFLDDPKMHGLTDSEILFWQRIVIQRGKSASPLRHCTSNYLALIGHREGRRVATVLVKLLKRRLISLSKERNKERNKDHDRTSLVLPEGFTEKDFEKIKPIMDRREITLHGLSFWLTLVPNSEWLVRKICELDAEVPFPIPFNEKPFSVRLRQYVLRHLEYEKDPKYKPTKKSRTIAEMIAAGEVEP